MGLSLGLFPLRTPERAGVLLRSHMGQSCGGRPELQPWHALGPGLEEQPPPPQLCRKCRIPITYQGRLDSCYELHDRGRAYAQAASAAVRGGMS